MRNITLIAAALVSTPAFASPHCDLITARAKESSSILRSGTAVARVGDDRGNNKTMIAGVSYSFGDLRQANAIDRAAAGECEVADITDAINTFVAFNGIHIDQLRARSENDVYTRNNSVIEAQRRRIQQMFDQHLITMAEYDNVMDLIASISNKKLLNDQTLSIANDFNDINLQNASTLLVEKLKDSEESRGAVVRASAFDINVTVGGRKVLENTHVSAFAMVGVKYAFGAGSSARATSRAVNAIGAVSLTDVNSPVKVVNTLIRTYNSTLPVLEDNRKQAFRRQTQYSDIINKLTPIGSVRSNLAVAVATLRKIHIEASIAGLDSQQNFISAHTE